MKCTHMKSRLLLWINVLACNILMHHKYFAFTHRMGMKKQAAGTSSRKGRFTAMPIFQTSLSRVCPQTSLSRANILCTAPIYLRPLPKITEPVENWICGRDVNYVCFT